MAESGSRGLGYGCDDGLMERSFGLIGAKCKSCKRMWLATPVAMQRYPLCPFCGGKAQTHEAAQPQEPEAA